MQTLYALFPFEQVEKDARVIIYGAGRAGLNFVRQVESGNYCKVVAIVDKNAKKHNSKIEVFEDIIKNLRGILEESFDERKIVGPIKHPWDV